MKLIDIANYNLIRISQKFNDSIIKKKRIAYWRNWDRSNKGGELNENQVKKVLEFYKPWTKVTTEFHAFYYSKTGLFDEKDLPDDLYYCYIDPYFNDWDEAHYIDNKTYYRLLFANIDQPTTLGFRTNGLWFDEASQQISLVLYPASF